MDKKAVPVHILSGFLGSGKTTLLTRVIDYYQLSGRKPAVLMNELGDVNLDGMLVDEEVPMTEMLGGCICCTIRGDLGMELKQLIEEHEPDAVFVECTGAANPIEMLDGITDASMLTRVELKSVVTVVDAAHLLERSRTPKARTYKLMQDQIRCATQIILNKADLVTPQELLDTESLLRELNGTAPITAAVKCEIDLSLFDRLEGGVAERHAAAAAAGGAEAGHRACSHSQEPGHIHDEHCGHGHGLEAEGGHTHHSHDHVMVHTHYFRSPVDSEAFEAMVGRLPKEIFRAKGILRFSDTVSPFLFQYAYREMDLMKITPKEELPSVAVFIGEHFDKRGLEAELAALEGGQS
ncbi:CobW family GTP-binding protein [Paenibacillus mucilaginosus]|uniref:Cobalamin synthesis protein P47K n=1 Tax=Paenibacillus mucilaginosus (strain KNP414) TaxID=1036673 RepID=F8F8M6_PAEMK|nr:GTP-binding protein [Paenibacillus mucilaginosus]AEI41614.1 cobalamin synthesis protein P47K [Paenibacillus mucilaginosus KNP414]MCG7214318.1 GTP-binding protein [Paenibacillus mucilaginosus]WDM30606.1 GTP-binding protein [Paenibacillus mucilaginosus]